MNLKIPIFNNKIKYHGGVLSHLCDTSVSFSFQRKAQEHHQERQEMQQRSDRDVQRLLGQCYYCDNVLVFTFIQCNTGYVHSKAL